MKLQSGLPIQDIGPRRGDLWSASGKLRSWAGTRGRAASAIQQSGFGGVAGVGPVSNRISVLGQGERASSQRLEAVSLTHWPVGKFMWYGVGMM